MFKTLMFAAVTCALPASAVAQTCTRDSLKTMAANYLKAIEADSLSAVPLAPNVRATENGLEIKAGEGFFKSGGRTQFQRHVVDTERCGIVTQAVIDEIVEGAAAPQIVAVRLRVAGGRISEIETIVNRKNELFFNPQGVLATKDQDWETPIPAGQRSTREFMNDAANRYFDSFAADPTNEPPYATPCHRWEGGVQTTLKTSNCSPKGLVLTHTHRRFPVTDLETGVTAAFVNFNQSLPDVHLFKFRDGRMELVQAVFGGRTTEPIWPAEPR